MTRKEKIDLIDEYLAESEHIEPHWAEMIREYRELLHENDELKKRIVFWKEHVELVTRCKDCKSYRKGTGWCDKLSFFQEPDGTPSSPADSMDWKMFKENDYCSFAERVEV